MSVIKNKIMSVVNTFGKNIESNILKEGFKRWNPRQWGTYIKISESHADWITSPIFSERNGKVGVSICRAYFEIESILQFIISRNIRTFYTFYDGESLENTTAQFSYDENGAKQASEYLTTKIFNDSLIKFGKFPTPEFSYTQHQTLPLPILQVGLEPKNGSYAIYRDLLMSKLYYPELYASKFKVATNHFNQIIKEYSET